MDLDEMFREQKAAERELRKWAKVHRQRDDVIFAAVAAGVDTRRIQQITGVARTTITRITQQRIREDARRITREG